VAVAAPASSNAGLEPELDWSAIAAKPSFPEMPFTLSDETVDAYLDATGERHLLYEPEGGGFVPPFYTTMVRLVKGSLGGRWPSGTIQLGQRVSTFRPLYRGERLTLQARIESAEIRKGRHFFETASILRDSSRQVVAVHSSMSMWAGAMASPDRRAGRSVTDARPTNTEVPAPDRPPPDFGPATAVFSLETLRGFGRVAGAQDPIHVDPDFARTTRYGTNIVQGRLVTTLISRLMLERFGMDWLRGSTLDIRFVGPALVGQPLRAWGRRLGNEGEYQVWCETADGVPLITGVARIGPVTAEG
jgi:3-hydroxybutyryl-CoA dehydratase